MNDTRILAAPTANPLTTRQQAIWEWMLRYQHERARPATLREIMAAFGIASPNGIANQIKAMIRKGYAYRDCPNKLRANYFAIIPGHAPDKATADNADGDQVRLRVGCVSCHLSRDEALALAARIVEVTNQ